MKTMINLLLHGNLIDGLLERIGSTISSKKLAFQPIPSYWELNPAERLAGMVKK